MRDHRRNERTSLAYHRVIAERLLADASVLAAAQRRVARWRREGSVHRRYADAWQEILARDPHDVAALLMDEGPSATALRQVSPFAGVLTPRERWRLWRAVRGDAA